MRTKPSIFTLIVSYGKARSYNDNSGTLRACSNDLQCLLESGVISSTSDLFSFLKKKQKKMITTNTQMVWDKIKYANV